MNICAVIVKMKRIRERLVEAGIDWFSEREKRRRNDTKELLYEEKGFGNVCPGGGYEPWCGGNHCVCGWLGAGGQQLGILQ